MPCSWRNGSSGYPAAEAVGADRTTGLLTAHRGIAQERLNAHERHALSREDACLSPPALAGREDHSPGHVAGIYEIEVAIDDNVPAWPHPVPGQAERWRTSPGVVRPYDARGAGPSSPLPALPLFWHVRAEVHRKVMILNKCVRLAVESQPKGVQFLCESHIKRVISRKSMSRVCRCPLSDPLGERITQNARGQERQDPLSKSLQWVRVNAKKD